MKGFASPDAVKDARFDRSSTCHAPRSNPLPASARSQEFDERTGDRFGNPGRHGYHFGHLDRRIRNRFGRLVREHAHSVNATVTGIWALPGAARPFASARAMTRFLNNDQVPFHALNEPSQDAVRQALVPILSRFALVVHDGRIFNFGGHDSKGDRYRRSHKADLGDELGSALSAPPAAGEGDDARDAPADRPVGVFTTGLGAPGGSSEGGVELFDEFRPELGKESSDLGFYTGSHSGSARSLLVGSGLPRRTGRGRQGRPRVPRGSVLGTRARDAACGTG